MFLNLSAFYFYGHKEILFSCGAEINLMLIIILKMIINYKNVDGNTFSLCYLLIT